jgi:hypothetical protein
MLGGESKCSEVEHYSFAPQSLQSQMLIPSPHIAVSNAVSSHLIDKNSFCIAGETAMWGEGINKDNFDAFVWREAAAAAERLWTTEMVLGCPEQICTGINAAAAAAGVKLPQVSRWLTDGTNPNRLDDQLCRMSRMGVRTGPIAPGFCPSDKDQAVQGATNFELEQRHRLEAQLGELRVQLAAALSSHS